MTTLRKDLRDRLAEVQPPPTAEVQHALREYMGKLDLTIEQIAERIGKGRSTLGLFLYSNYQRRTGSSDLWLRRAIWDFLQRHPIEVRARVHGRLFATENVRRIRKYFLRAVERGDVALLYGPPGTQKTFALEHLIAENNLAGRPPAFYVYASDHMRALALLKRIGRAAGIFTNVVNCERLLSSLLAKFDSLPKTPAVVVDEAQHLDVHCLEILRELHDRSGCGLVLAGSHTLFENFLRGRQHLEQWLSRIDHKDPLPGLQEEEVAQIAARELGNGQPAELSEAKKKKLVRMCRVEDVFARTADGRMEAREYLSVRRLVKSLAQLKEEREAVA
ncbi:MAG TPA: AAA family ATPase [Candidatus Nitrosotenuis sp.]|nr:AAA family ATPase [Candidatus Nitrosotenuis sp.]